MKRFVTLAMALVLTLSLAACGGSSNSSTSPAPVGPDDAPGGSAQPSAPASSDAPAAGDTFELALITDVGTINDKSFNQGSWEGLEQYALENGISHEYYQPAEKSDAAYLESIDLAVKGGAKLIVTPGFLFEVPIWEAQTRYPDVRFVLVDGVPHNADYSDNTIGSNVVAVNYAEQQAGFLAGYAAVKDGYTKLGFLGGMPVPAVIRFGYGFIQGADYAAKEMGVTGLTLAYHYTGNFDASPENQTFAASWYNDGAEIIFACGGAVGNSVMAAADAAGAKVIGVDIDQSGESPTVITSAMKGLQASVYNCVKAFYDGNFPGGQVQVFGADNNGVGLPMETSQFTAFTQADYDAVFAKLAAGEIPLLDDTAGETPVAIPAENVTVTYFE